MSELECTNDTTCEIPGHVVDAPTGALTWGGEPYYALTHTRSNLCPKCGNYFDTPMHELGCSDEG